MNGSNLKCRMVASRFLWVLLPSMGLAQTDPNLYHPPAACFRSPITQRAPWCPISLAAADFDGDGRMDLTVLYQCGNQPFTVLLGQGDGTFQTCSNAVPNSAAFVRQQLLVEDFNQDGKPDLATVNGLSNIYSKIHMHNRTEAVVKYLEDHPAAQKRQDSKVR